MEVQSYYYFNMRLTLPVVGEFGIRNVEIKA